MPNSFSSDITLSKQISEKGLALPAEMEKLSAENYLLKTEVDSLKDENQALKNRIAWFEKQIFGSKSEKLLLENPYQGNLLSEPTQTEVEAAPVAEVNGYQRGTAPKQRPDDCVTDSGLRFGPDVPVERIEAVPEELTGPDADLYEVIDTKVTYKLAEQPSAFVVLAYYLPVLKKTNEHNSELDNTEALAELITTPMPEQVLKGSIADVSLIVALLINKFLYHLPVHRQHQRMSHNGITVARSSLTNWVKHAIELLRPIVETQLQNILRSKVLAMDDKFVGNEFA